MPRASLCGADSDTGHGRAWVGAADGWRRAGGLPGAQGDVTVDRLITGPYVPL